jgi:hypothetical protein
VRRRDLLRAAAATTFVAGVAPRRRAESLEITRTLTRSQKVGGSVT